MDKKVSYKLFHADDYNSNWVLDQLGTQCCGEAVPYTKSPDTFLKDFKRMIDWAHDHAIDFICISGLLRERHGGLRTAEKICNYAHIRNVKICISINLYTNGGFYCDGDSPWCLDRFLADNPECIAQDEHANPIPAHYGHLQGCPANSKLNQYILKTLEWLFREFPQLDGILLNTGSPACLCPHCSKHNDSLAIMADILPAAAKVIWGQSPEALVICNTTIPPDTPLPPDLFQKILNMPEKLWFQWEYGRYTDQKLIDLLESFAKFHHILAAPAKLTEQHKLCIENIRNQCRFATECGINGIAIRGENSPFHTNDEFNYFAFQYFTNNPDATSNQFIADVMAPRLGCIEYAKQYLTYEPRSGQLEKIPEAIIQIGKISAALKDYEILRRWQWLAAYLNRLYIEWRADTENV